MAKHAPTATLDVVLDYIAGSNKLILCSAQPTTYTEANTTYNLASITVDSGDFVKGAGTVSGRKVTVGAQSNITVATTGTADHIALVNTSDSTLRYVTTCTSTGLTAATTISTGSWSVTQPAPS